MVCSECGGRGSHVVYEDAHGSTTNMCVCTNGRILRYPHLFGAVFEKCIVGHHDGFGEGWHGVYPDVHKDADCEGYIVRPVMEFWWDAPEALRNEEMSFELHLTTGEWLNVNGKAVQLMGRHPVLALIEALERSLPEKDSAVIR